MSATLLSRAALGTGILIGLATLAGCGGGGSSSTSTGSGATLTTTEATTSTAGTAAAGAAVDAGTNQLLGPALVAALRILPGTDADLVSDAPTSLEGLDALGEVLQPRSQAGEVDASQSGHSGDYRPPQGRVVFHSDQKGPGNHDLPGAGGGGSVTSGWWHCTMDFSASGQPFTVTTDEGNVVTVTGGTIQLYVNHTFTGTALAWNRNLDVYAIIPSSTPLLTTTTLTGAAGTVTGSTAGIRHANQAIQRTQAGGSITRIDTATIDGDMGGLPDSVRTALGVTDGPSLPLTTGGSSALFTRWLHQLGTGHTVEWNRHASHTVTSVRPVAGGSGTWSTSGVSEAIYLTRDGTRTGPLTGSDLHSRFGLTYDLTKLAGQW